MFINIRSPWEIAGLRPTEESKYLNRRTFIKALGLGTAAFTLRCETQGPEAIKNIIGGYEKSTDYTPTEMLNAEYVLDRPVTNEKKATTFNNFYEFSTKKDDVYKKVGSFVISPWKVEIGGLVNRPLVLDVDDIKKTMPIEERLYRFRCVEAWSMAVPWLGFRFSELVKMADPKPEATHVRFYTFMRPGQAVNQKNSRLPWPYREGITMAEAMNELTFMATGLYGKDLPKQNGAPMRLVLPWKYGFKSIKSIVKIEFTNERPATFWNTLVPDEYGFTANVNPKIPHPRWSQTTERIIDTGNTAPTLIYNGYGQFVANLYK
ncbi:MAG: protein-methionine-sulfoxide reductase catalytic subunit MsrP [Nitrospinota bacterium]